ncbi:protein translocase subunit [Penicillium waksmanii]|uniref:protein translocase subunit n=1 Tax=Penicillium waksmanii TaxID=69791 RepID=UPI002547FC6D|nr:protein translocase subunit [Penicillium waksmanii]KAJ5974509.1 protein translocase subunit [Penicillium waksmanii]
MSLFGSGSASPALPKSGSDVKAGIVQQLQQESAMNNARLLIEKINENCFDACIPAPGSSMSSQESGCISSCMEKYIQLWNISSKTYISRLGQEHKRMA